MNIFARQPRLRLKFLAILAVLSTAIIVSLILLYFSETIDLMTLTYASIVIFLVMLAITAVYSYFEGRRKTSSFIRFCHSFRSFAFL